MSKASRDKGARADRSRVGKRSRDKGARFECEIVRRLRGIGIEGIYTTRSLQARRHNDSDIEGTGWHIECGSGAWMNPRRKLEQAERAEQARGGSRPSVAIVREKSSRSITATTRLCCVCISCDAADDLDVVTMDFDDWARRVVREDLIGIVKRLGVDPSGETSDAPCFVADVLRDAVVRGQREEGGR